MATITDRYSCEDSFQAFLTAIGVTPAQANRLTMDGFETMKILVGYYQVTGPSDLEKYLRDLNKTFAGGAMATRVYFNPVIINRLAGCLNYFILSVHSLHTIPDISKITNVEANDYGRYWAKCYSDKKTAESNNDDETDIDLPKLKGGSTWIPFRDAFSHKLRDPLNNRGFSMIYLVDETIRQVTHGNATMLVADVFDIESNIDLSW